MNYHHHQNQLQYRHAPVHPPNFHTSMSLTSTLHVANRTSRVRNPRPILHSPTQSFLSFSPYTHPPRPLRPKSKFHHTSTAATVEEIVAHLKTIYTTSMVEPTPMARGTCTSDRHLFRSGRGSCYYNIPLNWDISVSAGICRRRIPDAKGKMLSRWGTMRVGRHGGGNGRVVFGCWYW